MGIPITRGSPGLAKVLGYGAGDKYMHAAKDVFGDADLELFDIIPGENNAYLMDRDDGAVKRGHLYRTPEEKAVVMWISDYDAGFSGKDIPGMRTGYKRLLDHFMHKGQVYTEGFFEGHSGLRSIFFMRKMKAANHIMAAAEIRSYVEDAERLGLSPKL